MKQIKKSDLPFIGQPLGGGFLTGVYRDDAGALRALITSPKAECELQGIWGDYGQDVIGAQSYTDGLANTKAMADAGSELAKKVLALRIAGLDDWHIPAQDQQELQYRRLKPTTNNNQFGRHGLNMSAEPPTRPYTKDMPLKTIYTLFQEGGTEAFEPTWYWSSTQVSAPYAFIQSFDVGYQAFTRRGNECCARAVRSILVIE